MNKKQVFVPDDAGSDMVTALRYLMGNPWASSRIANGDLHGFHVETARNLGVDVWTLGLLQADIPGRHIPHDQIPAALAYAPPVSTFDYVVPERRWVPERLEIVAPYCEVENPEDDDDDWVWKNREDMTPQENRAQKIQNRLSDGQPPFLTKGTTATVLDPELVDWRTTALRSWEVATNWEAQYRQNHHTGKRTAKQLQVFEDLVAGYERRFLVGLDEALDALVLATRNSPDFRAANIQILRGDINKPPNANAGKTPGVVVPG